MFETAIATLTHEVSDDAARIEQIRALEELKCRAAARQAELAAELDASRRADEAARGVPAARQGRGVAAEIALARRESPHRGQQHLGLAKILTTEMPHTMAAFRAGRITEWRATLLVRETACLPLDDRRHVDQALAGDPDALERMGDREVVAAACRLAAELDPASVAERRRRAESDRTVTLRPAPDTMTYLTALLPVAQGVAALAALTREAGSRRSEGDPRSKGQVMADILVERITGQADAADVPVTVNLVVSDQALLGGGDEPAQVDGHGPVPASLARAWISESTAVALRRLYARAADGQLVALESRSRAFPEGLAQLIRFRDRDLRDTVVRRSDPTSRPHRPGRTGWAHQFRPRSGALRGVQPRQASQRLAITTTLRHHTERPHLPVPRPAGSLALDLAQPGGDHVRLLRPRLLTPAPGIPPPAARVDPCGWG